MLLSQSQLRTFAEKENVVLDERKVKNALDKFMHDINESIQNCITEI